MGWHIGMSQEEMKEHFGGGGGTASASAQGSTEPCESEPTAASASAAPASEPPSACPLPTNPDGSVSSQPPAPPHDHAHVFHLCRKRDWEAAKASQTPYFPRTFLRDGKFTRASLYLDDIADVANEYYAAASPPEEEWIVLQMDVQFVYHGLGIPVLAAMAPESVRAGAPTNPVNCLQIFGGVSTHPNILESLVTAVFFMKRRQEDGKFIGMLSGDSGEPTAAGSPLKSPRKSPLKSPLKSPAKEVDEVLELPTEENGASDKKDAGTSSTTKKKKKGLFSKLKAKK